MGLLRIFYEPGKVFDRVRETGEWLAPFLACTLVALLTGIVAIHLIGMENITRKALEANPRIVALMGQDNVDRAVRLSNTPGARGRAYASSAMRGAIYLLLSAGIFTGLLAMMGGRVKYKQALGAVGYAYFPFALVTLVMSTLIIALSSDRGELDIANLIALNPGAFMNKETSGRAIYSLATSLDLISFGQIAMLAYGLAKISGLSFVKCLAMAGILWGMIVLAKAGFAAAF